MSESFVKFSLLPNLWYTVRRTW